VLELPAPIFGRLALCSSPMRGRPARYPIQSPLSILWVPSSQWPFYTVQAMPLATGAVRSAGHLRLQGPAV
jgi:hypothetical protein